MSRLLSFLISTTTLVYYLLRDVDHDVFTADPVTALLLVGGAATVGSTIQKGRLAEAQGDAENEIAQFNAKQLDRQAKARVKASEIQEERVARGEKMLRGEQRAKFSKSLVSISDGTPLDVLADTAFQFHLERNLTLRQGLVEGEQLRTQGGLLRTQGKLAKGFGKTAKRLSLLKAFGQGALAGSQIGGGTPDLSTNPLSSVPSPVTTGNFGVARNFAPSAF